MSKKTSKKTKQKYDYAKICAIVALVCDLILYIALSQRFYLVFLTFWVIPILNFLNFFLGKKVSDQTKMKPLGLVLSLIVAQILLTLVGMLINVCINHGLTLCTTHDGCIVSDYPLDFILLVVWMAQFNMVGIYIGAVVGCIGRRKGK